MLDKAKRLKIFASHIVIGCYPHGYEHEIWYPHFQNNASHMVSTMQIELQFNVLVSFFTMLDYMVNEVSGCKLVSIFILVACTSHPRDLTTSILQTKK